MKFSNARKSAKALAVIPAAALALGIAPQSAFAATSPAPVPIPSSVADRASMVVGDPAETGTLNHWIWMFNAVQKDTCSTGYHAEPLTIVNADGTPGHEQALWGVIDGNNTSVVTWDMTWAQAMATWDGIPDHLIYQRDSNGTHEERLPNGSDLTGFVSEGDCIINDKIIPNGYNPGGGKVVIDKPSITTKAFDAADGDKVVNYNTRKLTDLVDYKGLQVGEKYTVTGVLVDKSTGKATDTISSIYFVNTQPINEVSVSFDIPASYAGKSFVVFETIRDSQGTVIAEHKDMNSVEQSFSVEKAPVVTPKPPVVVTPKTKTVTFDVQVDRWAPKTKTQASLINKINLDGKYAYRETMKKTDKMSPLWVKGINTPTTTKVSVVVPANATPAQIQAAKVAQVSKQFGAKGGKAVVGKKLVNVYEIPVGAWSAKTKAGTGWNLKPQLLLK